MGLRLPTRLPADRRAAAGSVGRAAGPLAHGDGDAPGARFDPTLRSACAIPKVVSTSPHRENLAFDVLPCGGGARHRALVRLALRVRRPGIIYCATTREVDEMYTVLQRFGIPSHRYHGKMTSAQRARGKSQDAFMQRGRRTVMVATNAFGLGIDKPDIRYVMHYQSPASLEQYVQEAGRAGRDGRRANCIMLYSHEDRAVHEALLSRSRVRPEQLYKLGKALAAWATRGQGAEPRGAGPLRRARRAHHRPRCVALMEEADAGAMGPDRRLRDGASGRDRDALPRPWPDSSRPYAPRTPVVSTR